MKIPGGIPTIEHVLELGQICAISYLVAAG